MKRLILILVTSCCMIILFAIPVFATSYTFTQGGGPAKIKYDLASVFESTILNAINEACGTTENVYYVCRKDPTDNETLTIYIMLDVEVKGIKGNVGYVYGDNHGLYTNSLDTVPYWRYIYISDFGKYFSRYMDAGGGPLNYYPNSGSDQYGACLFYTNIPIFNTKGGLDDYFATGNTSDMIGYGGEYSPDVPIVTNAYVSYKGNYNDHVTLYVNFDFPVEAEGYTAEIYQCMKSNLYYRTMSGFKKTEFYYEGTKQKLTDVTYRTTSVNFEQSKKEWSKLENEIRDMDSLVENSAINKYKKFPYLLTKDTLYCTYPIMEFYIQLTNGSKKGDIVKLTVNCSDLDTGSALDVIQGENTGKGSADVVDGSGGIDNVDDADVKDSYDYGNNSNYNSENIIGYIKSGFGLIGDDGLIPMLGRIFSFLPAPVITIMLATFSAVAAVIVLKFVRG